MIPVIIATNDKNNMLPNTDDLPNITKAINNRDTILIVHIFIKPDTTAIITINPPIILLPVEDSDVDPNILIDMINIITRLIDHIA